MGGGEQKGWVVGGETDRRHSSSRFSSPCRARIRVFHRERKEGQSIGAEEKRAELLFGNWTAGGDTATMAETLRTH